MTFRSCLISVGMIIIIISFSACDITPKPTHIESGMSQELVTMLKDQYHVIIPESAIFIEGYYDNEYQDNSVHITFKVSSNLCNTLYDNDWTESDLIGSIGAGPEGVERTMKFKGEPYTYLSFYPANDNKEVTVYFQGRYPKKVIT